MSEIDEVRKKIAATEAEIAVAKRSGDVDGLKFNRELLLKLQDEKLLLLRQKVETVQVETPMDRFCRLMKEQDVVVDETIMGIISGTGNFPSRLDICYTQEQAQSLYEDAFRVPQTKTRAKLLQNSNISIDCAFIVPGVQNVSFFKAFYRVRHCRILKIPSSPSQVDSEVEMFGEIFGISNALTFNEEIPLVPVMKLDCDFVHIKQQSPDRNIRSGILMPFFCCTLSEIQLTINCVDYIKEIINRLSMALNIIHDHKWLHGDVKCSNIFVDNSGLVFLGDYGSSVRIKNISSCFCGGTLKYQCVDVSALDNPILFDRIGLALSVLDRLSKLKENTSIRFEELITTIGSIENEKIKNELLKLVIL